MLSLAYFRRTARDRKEYVRTLEAGWRQALLYLNPNKK